jgi:hypothetical protein
MITDEVYYLSRHGQIGSINEVALMPTWKRRYYLYKLNDEFEKQKEQIDKANRKNSAGSGFSKKRR